MKWRHLVLLLVGLGWSNWGFLYRPFPLARGTRLPQSPRTGKKVSPNESVLQHHFATSNLLKNFRVWDRCVIARLCDSPEYLSE